ncbi:MAG: FlgO family outer membrane protein [Rhodocyclaceae bacterium]|nr:FlgO family outer membrane protein [Rhodocyclaceae bacterium]
MTGLSRLLILALAIVALAGCAKPSPQLHVYTPKPPTDFIKTSYGAGDALISQIAKTLPAADSALIVATLVNINRLDESSPLGRLVAEHLAARFSQNGYRVVETKLRNQLYMKRDAGELILSREIRDVAKKHSVRAIVSGTYADSSDRVFVSLKIIEIESNVVMAAFDYALDKDKLTKSLLSSS